MSILVYTRGELAVDSRVVVAHGGKMHTEDSGRKYRYPHGPFTFHGHKVLLWAYVGSNIMARAWDYRYQLMAAKEETGFLSYADTSRFLILEEGMKGEQLIITDGPIYVASLDGTLIEYPPESTIILGDAKERVTHISQCVLAAWLYVATAIRHDERCGGVIHRFTFKEGSVQEQKPIGRIFPFTALYYQALACGSHFKAHVRKKLTLK
ncbi:hypothetical protein [Erwinia phage vB_Ea277G]|nr:hypothetical protein [Erwinia phage vB_Ea277G]